MIPSELTDPICAAFLKTWFHFKPCLTHTPSDMGAAIEERFVF